MGRRQAARAPPPRQASRQADLEHRSRGSALTVYLDTSALLKLYLDEEGADLVRERVSGAAVFGTSIITYVEARSALARRHREGDLSTSALRRVAEGFESDWERYVRTEVTEELLRHAAALAGRHRLRAHDAVHLASAMLLRDRLGGETTFASWDEGLDRAAAREEFRLLRARTR